MDSLKEKQPASQGAALVVADSKMSDVLSKVTRKEEDDESKADNVVAADSVEKEDIESLETEDSGRGSDQSRKSSE